MKPVLKPIKKSKYEYFNQPEMKIFINSDSKKVTNKITKYNLIGRDIKRKV